MTVNNIDNLPLVRVGNEYRINHFPVLTFPDQNKDIKYFSVNPFLPDKENRCPLDCQYCICHKDNHWHYHPENYTDQVEHKSLVNLLVDKILLSKEGRAGLPISLCDYSDPFLMVHQNHVLSCLNELGLKGSSNMVYITTKINPGLQFLMQLKEVIDRFSKLKVSVFVSLAPLIEGVEPVSISQRVKLLKSLVRLGIPCCWYLRPLTESWYNQLLLEQLAQQLIPVVKSNILLSNLVMSQEIEDNLQKHQLPIPNWSKTQPGKKILLSKVFEHKVRTVLFNVAHALNIDIGPIMSHRLCGVNGHHNYSCHHCDKSDRYCQLFKQNLNNKLPTSLIDIKNVE